MKVPSRELRNARLPLLPSHPVSCSYRMILRERMGYRRILPRTSDYWEACARHTSRHTARTLQCGYYCDRCARRLTREAFNDRPPVYHGARVKGFCGLCNKRKQVFLRQWFACGECCKLIVGYQKSC